MKRIRVLSKVLALGLVMGVACGMFVSSGIKVKADNSVTGEPLIIVSANTIDKYDQSGVTCLILTPDKNSTCGSEWTARGVPYSDMKNGTPSDLTKYPDKTADVINSLIASNNALISGVNAAQANPTSNVVDLGWIGQVLLDIGSQQDQISKSGGNFMAIPDIKGSYFYLDTTTISVLTKQISKDFLQMCRNTDYAVYPVSLKKGAAFEALGSDTDFTKLLANNPDLSCTFTGYYSPFYGETTGTGASLGDDLQQFLTMFTANRVKLATSDLTLDTSYLAKTGKSTDGQVYSGFQKLDSSWNTSDFPPVSLYTKTFSPTYVGDTMVPLVAPEYVQQLSGNTYTYYANLDSKDTISAQKLLIRDSKNVDPSEYPSSSDSSSSSGSTPASQIDVNEDTVYIEMLSKQIMTINGDGKLVNVSKNIYKYQIPADGLYICNATIQDPNTNTITTQPAILWPVYNEALMVPDSLVSSLATQTGNNTASGSETNIPLDYKIYFTGRQVDFKDFTNMNIMAQSLNTLSYAKGANVPKPEWYLMNGASTDGVIKYDKGGANPLNTTGSAPKAYHISAYFAANYGPTIFLNPNYCSDSEVNSWVSSSAGLDAISKLTEKTVSNVGDYIKQVQEVIKNDVTLYASISWFDMYNLNRIRESIVIMHQDDFIGGIFVFLDLAGIVLVFYCLTLFLMYWIERLIPFPFVRIMTFGHMIAVRNASEKQETYANRTPESKSVIYVAPMDITIRCAIGVIISMLMLNTTLIVTIISALWQHLSALV